MCKDFSCIVTQSYQVAWKRGMSSHDQIYSVFKDTMPELSDNRSVKVEIKPDKGYLYPDEGWTLKIDETEPSWWTAAHASEAMKAQKLWQKEVYALINLKEVYALINLKEVHKPINPMIGKAKQPEQVDIDNLKVWSSVWSSVKSSVLDLVMDSAKSSVGDSVMDSVMASVWASVWSSANDSVWSSVMASVMASVWDSVMDSVWVYAGSLINIWDGEYKYQSAVDLWRRGFVALFDGTTWWLYSGKNATVVYELRA